MTPDRPRALKLRDQNLQARIIPLLRYPVAFFPLGNFIP